MIRSAVHGCLFIAILALPGIGARAGDDLASKIEAVISGPDYKQARWGILIVDGDTGKTVYEHNADKLCIPASTTKLYSCAAAMIAFGADHRFETPVYRRGTLTDGRLQGDLILVAQGDLTMGGRNANGIMAFKDNDHTYAGPNSPKTELTDTDPLAGLKDLARQIKESGIRQVDGDVLIDDRLFARAAGSGSGPSILSPILINDNVVDVTVTPSATPASPAVIHLRPETAYFQVDAQVTTVASKKPTRLEIMAVGPQRFVVRGELPVDSRPLIRVYPVDDPAGFVRALFIEALRHEGVNVKASPLQAPQGTLPEKGNATGLTQVAIHRSLPLSEALKVTLKVSHNLYASTLPLLLAAKHGKTTLAEGLRIERQILADLGVDTATISFAGGAGGANADSVTPRATIQLLRAMAKRPDYAAYHAGLPILGVDGTLAEAIGADSAAKSKAQAKTGTLMWQDLLNDRTVLRSKALAGTVTTKSGRSLFVAMFVNDVPLPKGVTTAREGKTLGKLCEILYEHTP